MPYLFKADLPYPTTEIKTHNVYEVRLLMPAYGGKESETTAIFNYIYGHYILEDTHPEISRCLKQIAIAEMHHHDLLGTTIIQLGGTPYIGGNYSYWQGGYVNYAKNADVILKSAIIAEKEAIRDYKNIIAQTQIPEVRALIERIIMDEEVHIVTLDALLETLKTAS